MKPLSQRDPSLKTPPADITKIGKPVKKISSHCKNCPGCKHRLPRAALAGGIKMLCKLYASLSITTAPSIESCIDYAPHPRGVFTIAKT